MNPIILRMPLVMLFGDGLTVCPWLVLIRWEVPDGIRKHLVPHELCHVAQQRADGWLRFWWRYITDQKAKLVYELEAYRVSIANGMPLSEAARVLATYRIKINGVQLTPDQASFLLTGKML